MNNDKEVRYITPELRASEKDGVKRISGYAAVFDSWSEDLGWFREKISPGAFRDALKTSDTMALFNHDHNIILGRQSAGTLRLKEDERGLHMEVDLPDTQVANDVYELIDRGDVRGQSFGFSVGESEWRYKDDTEELDERTIIKVKELFDVGPVTYPAYPDTSVAKRSHDDKKPVETNSESDATVAENEDIEIELFLSQHGVENDN